MKFIHLSDLHFHRREADNEEAVRTLKFVREHYPDHKLIITGDIVDDGDEIQCIRAREALDAFCGNVFICPGNHDFGAAGNFYGREKAERFDRLLCVPLQQGGTFTGYNTPVVNVATEGDNRVMLIALDTNVETDHPWDFACGEVGSGQLAALDALLSHSTASSMRKVVFFHHHLFVRDNPFMELKDAKQLMRVIYNRVDVVLFGHKHVPDKWVDINGIQWIFASGNSPAMDAAWEITVENGQVFGGAVLTR